ncbi:B2 bradykinin receptor-like [Hyla sarda]|uniref:B2 bradykinin receptor-like n=1 Tax=Hyla sarda TaxID=327740 RepID=UPI0024C3D995|nr:B2 bradykinin receptor-like [Hyla sarda]
MMNTGSNGTMTILANTNETLKGTCLGWEVSKWLLTYQPPYMWVIFVLGFIENLFVISVFVLHKSRCTVTEIYLANMAAADLIFASSLPFRAISSLKKYWPFGGFMCATVFSMFRLNLFSSIYTLMMVSIERYLALVKAMSIGRLKNPWWAKVICGIIWIFAALLIVPNIVIRKVVFKKELNTTVCVTDKSSQHWFIVPNIIINVLGFLVPLVVTSFCTFHIICVLRNNAKKQFKKKNKDKKATRLVLSVFLVFVMCWLPFNITIIITTLGQLKVFIPCTVKNVNSFVHHISTYLAFSNSCINPIIYSMVGNQFRQKAKEVYRRLLCKGLDRRT